MKKNLLLIKWLYILISIFLFSSCYKVNWFGDNPPSEKKYQVEQCISSMYNLDHPFLFAKTYSGTNTIPTGIYASFFNETDPASLFKYDLRIIYKGAFIYLINKTNAFDTTYTIRLNSQNRPIAAYGDEDLQKFQFRYKNNRLVAIDWENYFVDSCVYDSYGNILSIKENGAGIGYTFGYDYSRKGKYQYYQDELRTVDNGFTLLCYLGLFPELNPVNVRTYVRLGPDSGMAYWLRYLINHEFDDKGRLIKYGITSNPGSEAYYFMTIKWRPL